MSDREWKSIFGMSDREWKIIFGISDREYEEKYIRYVR